MAIRIRCRVNNGRVLVHLAMSLEEACALRTSVEYGMKESYGILDSEPVELLYEKMESVLREYDSQEVDTTEE